MRTIRRFFLGLLLVFFYTTTAYSQFQFGVNLGANLSGLQYQKGQNPKNKLGFVINAVVDYNFANGLFLESGLGYSTKGAQVNVGAEVQAYHLKYLVIPARLGYKMGVTPTTTLFLKTGPYWGVNLKSDKGIPYTRVQDREFDNKDLSRDFGWGAEFSSQFDWFVINIGYEYGFNNIAQFLDNTVTNRNAYVTFGLRF